MNWVDYSILAIIGVSVVIGLLRGFTREVLSLIGWVVAVWVTLAYTDELEHLFVPYVETPGLRVALAVALLFVLTLLVAALVNYLLGRVIEKSGLSGTDRLIGVVFGFVRGCAFVAAFVFLAGLTSLPQDTWWRQSQLIHYFQDMALWLRTFLPPEVAANLRY